MVRNGISLGTHHSVELSITIGAEREGHGVSCDAPPTVVIFSPTSMPTAVTN